VGYQKIFIKRAYSRFKNAAATTRTNYVPTKGGEKISFFPGRNLVCAGNGNEKQENNLCMKFEAFHNDYIKS
jgi:hypothetical protein